MSEQVTFSNWAPTADSQVTVKIEMTTRVNVSEFVARQRANHFLIVQAGDQLCAGDPELVIGPTLYWRLPVHYAPSRQGTLGVVGHVLVDADTGEVTLADDRTIENLLEGAELLYERATLPAGT